MGCKVGEASDKVGDAPAGKDERDIVGDATFPALYTYDDGSFFYFRVRLDDTPEVTTGGNKPLSQFGWGVGVDTDSDTTTIEFAVVVNGIDETVNLTDNVSKKNALKTWQPTLGAKGYVEVKKATDGSNFGGDDDYFMTVAVPMKEAADATSGAAKPLFWGKIAIWISTSTNGFTLDKDFMCWDEGAGSVKLDEAATQPIIIGTHVAITAPTALASSATLTLAGDAEPGVTVTLTLNGQTTTVVADKDGKWSFKVPASWGLKDGQTYKLVAEVKDDGDGNSAKDEQTFKLGIAGFVAIDALTKPANSTTPTITGTSKPGAKVTVAINGHSAEVTADSNGKWSLPVPASWGLQSDASYPVEATTDDGAGGTAKATAGLTIEAPSIAITLPSSATATITSLTPTIEGTAHAGAKVTVTINGKTETVTADSNGKWTFKVPVTFGLAFGKTYTVAAETERNGAKATTSVAITLLADPLPTCSNGKLDGDETDIDCGGLCVARCADTKKCKLGADCQSGNCDATKTPNVCIPPPGPSCTNGKRDGTETDIDCGGTCTTGCDNGEGCAKADDCKSNLCNTVPKSPICVANPTCTDGKQGGDETDIDCGGSCPNKCADKKGCKVAKDCQSGTCDNTQNPPICGPAASCTDGTKNGDETDKDCGGSCPNKCDGAKGCAKNDDCKSALCDTKTTPPACQIPTSCTDTQLNGDETDVDCGGSCATKCAPDKGCKVGGDCTTNACDTKKTPPVCFDPPSCTNAKKDGDETDVDCGGSCAEKCDKDEGCKVNDDCKSKSCDAGKTDKCLVPPTCSDTIKNGDETDVDCGGSCATKCAKTKGCKLDADCAATLACSTAGICEDKDTCTDGNKNGDETDIDCGGSCKTPCKDGRGCTKGQDCESTLCDAAAKPPVCVAGPACDDGKQNGDETDIDCGGSCKTKCTPNKGCKLDVDCSTGSCDKSANPAVCVTPAACTDGKLDGDETDVDCGGACPTKCEQDKLCKVDADCKSVWCGGDGKCRKGCPDAPDPTDCDGDGLPNHGKPGDKDSKSDDKNNNGKVDPGETDPFQADTDKDGINDGAEFEAGTDPSAADLKLKGGGCGAGGDPGSSGWPALLLLAAAFVLLRRRTVVPATVGGEV